MEVNLASSHIDEQLSHTAWLLVDSHSLHAHPPPPPAESACELGANRIVPNATKQAPARRRLLKFRGVGFPPKEAWK
jgi:hypothetical protein